MIEERNSAIDLLDNICDNLSRYKAKIPNRIDSVKIILELPKVSFERFLTESKNDFKASDESDIHDFSYGFYRISIRRNNF